MRCIHAACVCITILLLFNRIVGTATYIRTILYFVICACHIIGYDGIVQFLLQGACTGNIHTFICTVPRPLNSIKKSLRLLAISKCHKTIVYLLFNSSGNLPGNILVDIKEEIA